jgi:peptidoglycan/LPS O-acetylase OafA/YrhL
MNAAETTASPGKLVPLEGLRGIAAAIVVLYHLVLGFTPKGVGKVPHGHGFWDTIAQFGLGLLNGGAAVAVFFVLSGFILSLPFARDRRVIKVIIALLKRWPRLAALTTIACLFAWAAITLSHDNYKQAAGVIGAGWMATHGNAPLDGQELSWFGALKEGLFDAFAGDVHFDSPLWTMRIELFGSFAVFLAAPILFAIRSWPLRLALTAAAMLAAGSAYPFTYLSDFLVGTLLAMLFAENKLPNVSNWQAAIAVLAGIYLFSFTYEQKLLIHAPIKAVIPAGDTSHFVWDIGAVLLIGVLLGNPFLRRIFSKTWAVWLGLLSFPIYLLHGPIMLSAGAASFMTGLSALGVAGSAMAAAAITIVLTLLCAVPLVWIDKAWTGILSQVTTLLMKAQRAPARTSFREPEALAERR